MKLRVIFHETTVRSVIIEVPDSMDRPTRESAARQAMEAADRPLQITSEAHGTHRDFNHYEVVE